MRGRAFVLCIAALSLDSCETVIQRGLGRVALTKEHEDALKNLLASNEVFLYILAMRDRSTIG